MLRVLPKRGEESARPPVCLDANKTSAISSERAGRKGSLSLSRFSLSLSKAKRTNWAIFISALSSRMRGTTDGRARQAARFFHSRLCSALLLLNDVCVRSFVRLRRYRDPRPFLALNYDLGLQNRLPPPPNCIKHATTIRAKCTLAPSLLFVTDKHLIPAFPAPFHWRPASPPIIASSQTSTHTPSEMEQRSKVGIFIAISPFRSERDFVAGGDHRATTTNDNNGGKMFPVRQRSSVRLLCARRRLSVPTACEARTDLCK